MAVEEEVTRKSWQVMVHQDLEVDDR